MSKRKPIEAFLSPCALASNLPARRQWANYVSQSVNGWGIITAEKHRVSALQGNDLVHFAPVGADFDNPAVLDDESKSAALDAAIQWCKSNSRIYSQETVLASLHDDLKESVKVVARIRKDVLNASCHSSQVLAHQRLKNEEMRLGVLRSRWTEAEKAIRDSIRVGNESPFIGVSAVFPVAAKVLSEFLQRQQLQPLPVAA